MGDDKTYYKLRTTLVGHTLDVRAIDVSIEGHILTASRDKTARLWVENELDRTYIEKVIYQGHSGYVTSVCFLPGNSNCPEGMSCTGSRDSTIIIYQRYSGEPIHTLSGHSDTVSCLWVESDLLISGSWDHSIRVWKDFKCEQELKGHNSPIWSVKAIPQENNLVILSASADKTIKSWINGKVSRTFSGHSDCVRGLAIVGREHFLSCSNDASVKLWHLTSGECLGTFYGHTNFIYSIFLSEQKEIFATGGEDRTLRIWHQNGGNILQTLHMPAQSVWCVAILPNGDIVAGSSDGCARIFSCIEELQADAEDQKVFEALVASCKVPVQDIGGIKASSLPDATSLYTPGERDGQTAMVRDGETVVAYSWSMAKKEWEKVGEVVGGAGGDAKTSGRVLYCGKEYDYVFDVDVDIGQTLKLPYNRSEDPWTVAQKFIHTHELPQDYLEKVADFICTNANNISSQPSGYTDPFTGGSRYVPGGGSATSRSSGGAAAGDPFTSGSRYVPGGDNATNGVSGGTPGDPFTSGSRYVPGGASQAVSCHSQFFPQNYPLCFEAYNASGMLSKFKEHNSKMEDSLSEEEVVSMVETVGDASSDPEKLSPLERALQWPVDMVWPALDVLRLALRSRKLQERWISVEKKGEPLVDLLTSLLSSSSIPTRLLSLRCLSNLASHAPGQTVLTNKYNSVLSPAMKLSPFANKNLEIAAATLVINYSILACRDSNDINYLCQVLSSASTLILTCNDVEAQFRSLVALGTLLCKPSDTSEVKALASSLDVKSIVKNLSAGDSKTGSCARELLTLL